MRYHGLTQEIKSKKGGSIDLISEIKKIGGNYEKNIKNLIDWIDYLNTCCM